MQVLCVLSFKFFKDREIHIKTYVSSYAKIKELEVALQSPDESKFFEYQKENK